MPGFEIKNPAAILRPWSSVKDLSEGIFSLLVPIDQKQSLRPSSVPAPPPKAPPQRVQSSPITLPSPLVLNQPAGGGGVYPPPGASPASQFSRNPFPAKDLARPISIMTSDDLGNRARKP